MLHRRPPLQKEPPSLPHPWPQRHQQCLQSTLHVSLKPLCSPARSRRQLRQLALRGRRQRRSRDTSRRRSSGERQSRRPLGLAPRAVLPRQRLRMVAKMIATIAMMRRCQLHPPRARRKRHHRMRRQLSHAPPRLHPHHPLPHLLPAPTQSQSQTPNQRPARARLPPPLLRSLPSQRTTMPADNSSPLSPPTQQQQSTAPKLCKPSLCKVFLAAWSSHVS